MTEQQSPGKPFEISKMELWRAWVKVRDNKGAAGIDRQSIADFERDVHNNLYKIWLRHEALVVRMGVRDPCRLAVVAVG